MRASTRLLVHTGRSPQHNKSKIEGSGRRWLILGWGARGSARSHVLARDRAPSRARQEPERELERDGDVGAEALGQHLGLAPRGLVGGYGYGGVRASRRPAGLPTTSRPWTARRVRVSHGGLAIRNSRPGRLNKPTHISINRRGRAQSVCRPGTSSISSRSACAVFSEGMYHGVRLVESDVVERLEPATSSCRFGR